MGKKAERGNFSGKIGFIMAAAGSAVGLGNIWRFPYLAAKDNGGVFLLCYIILAVTFGFTLLTTEVAIGRKTAQGPLTAYGVIHKKWRGIGVIACLVPIMILPYYCVIGGWVIKYFLTFATGESGAAAGDSYFTGYITAQWEPIIWMVVFLLATSFVIYSGVNKGIEKYSKILMPVLLLLVLGISIYSLTLCYTDETGVTRTGLQGLEIYLIPNFAGMTLKKWMLVIMDAMGQLFFSISVAMGIMVAYGSYVKKDVNLMQSINYIEIFDTIVAVLAGMMIIPTVYIFMGIEGMGKGPGLMFVSLPKVFAAMGAVGPIIGVLFFVMVLFAAVTSSVSVMEAIVSSFMDGFGWSRKKCVAAITAYALVGGIIVCLGYNILYFEVKLPNGNTAQILDIMDYISNNLLMPVVAILTCILIGWVAKPVTVIEEVERGRCKFRRKYLYIAMIKVIAPVLMFILLLQSVGIFSL